MAAIARRTFAAVILIIGSGAGGGTAGNELAQKGICTLILEAGPRTEREQHVDDERQAFAQLTWLDNEPLRDPGRSSRILLTFPCS
jgi:choline dehydrogenase-like flavoprotein